MDQINNFLSKIPGSSEELVNFVTTVNLSPVFICVHYLLVALSMRKRLGSCEYAHHHPFPSLFVYVTSCFGGTLIMNFLLGQPIVIIYSNMNNVLLASFIWWLVFFSPFDVVEKLSQVKLIKALLLSSKEVHRMRMIINGIDVASQLHPDKHLVIVLIGSIKGCGAKFLLRPLDNFIRGDIISDNEFLKPSFSTKYAVLASVLIHLTRIGVLEFAERNLICVLVVSAAVLQLVLLFSSVNDPFERVEDLICMLLFRERSDTKHEESKKKTD